MHHGTLHGTRPGSRRCCGLFSRSRQRAERQGSSPGGGGGGSGGGGSSSSGSGSGSSSSSSRRRMFTTGAESLLRQARAGPQPESRPVTAQGVVSRSLVAGLPTPSSLFRELRDEELGRLCARVCALLREEDWGPDAPDALRRLFLIVSATKYNRRLERPCLALLQTTLCSPTCPEQLQLLCAAVLREMSPCDSLSLSCDHIQNTRQLGLVASVLLAQGDQQQVRSLAQRVLKVLESRQPEGPSLRHLLPIVSKVTSLAPDALREEQTRALSKRLGDWLRYASVQQAVAHSSGGFFSTPRARQLGPVTEVDGAVATDFFTVLSTGQRFTEDQWLNVQAFSMLRAWLLDSGPGGSSAPDADDKSELEGSTLSVLSAASTAGHLLPPQQWLREKAFEYCQRLLEQSNRRALKKADSDLQKACLVEAVLVLDVLCQQDPSFLYRTLSCLKPLHTRLRGDPAWVRALLPVAQFFLHHGEAAAVDAEAVYQHLFTRIPAEHFHSPMLAFEFVQFCRDSLPLFGRNLGILRTSFPNLFKFLAWNSPPLTSDFVALLPSLVDAGTAVEMLHLLLDLPCLTAALDLQLRSLQAASERPPWDVSIRAPGCLEALRDSQVQGLFQHLLRAHASGTVERLTPLYRLLQPLAGCARVVQCAEAVPTLLRAFFSAVTQFADGALASQLALLLLERSDSLYQVPGYEAGVHRWVPPGGLRPSCGSMAQPWTGSLTPRALPLTAAVPQLPPTPAQPRHFLGHCTHPSLPTQAPLPRSLPERVSPLLKAQFMRAHPRSSPASSLVGQEVPGGAGTTFTSTWCSGASRHRPALLGTGRGAGVCVGQAQPTGPLVQGAELPVPGPVQAASSTGGRAGEGAAGVRGRPPQRRARAHIRGEAAAAPPQPACDVRACHRAEVLSPTQVWAIGEYLSVSWDRRCTVEQINNFFEALEALLFEVTQSRPSTTLPKCPPQVITVLMTTLTKLASRSQDLIPRVDFCGGWESSPTTRVQIRRGWAVPGVSAAAAEPPGASEAVRTRAGLRPGGWRASRAHSPGPGAHCSRAEGGPGWLLPEVGFCRVVLTALTALAH
ncbi:AP-5 complex subunit zeta-1 isoform X6 [Globicephala melas]|uniref:AP-5 complex subunit zeta-1 isoform X6 n=1 Tax=Globicephala melas TaxID=9731 RepID=UPI00293D5E23|nr:AP-5 complex subunit zeta-1 isoform X6 [Globicephala melas]